MLEMFLGAIRHDVTVEYVATKALECTRLHALQVCLLDIGLADMDGHELERHLRGIPETAKLLLIAATGYSQEQDYEKSIAAGFDYHFARSLDIAKLASLLNGISQR